MGKRIVGYVISHSGKPGGPWEANDFGAWGISTSVAKKRIVWLAQDHAIAVDALPKVWPFHPAARILRLVRRERHRAEEAAVVEAALAWDRWRSSPRPAPKSTFRELALAGNRLAATCAALRAKRGG